MGSRRPLIEAVRAQQNQIEALRATIARQDLQIAFLGKVAGLSEHFEAIKRQADIANPGQPVPDPAPEQPVATTEQAVTPEAYDNVQQLGETPGANQHIQAPVQDNPLTLGESFPTAPFGAQQNVTAPVPGTNTGEVPLDAVRTEVDVRVGDPDNPEPAFPWTINQGQQAQASSNRTMAAMRLARLRVKAGLANEDDLVVAASIESDASLSDRDIEHEINVLSRVDKVASRKARPAGLVPRAASVQRTVPSLVGDTNLSTTASVSDTDDATDIFL